MQNRHTEKETLSYNFIRFITKWLLEHAKDDDDLWRESIQKHIFPFIITGNIASFPK